MSDASAGIRAVTEAEAEAETEAEAEAEEAGSGGLDPERLLATTRRLDRRIAERFPGSGLSRVCSRLSTLAARAKQTCKHIARPNLRLRALSAAFSGLLLLALIGGVVIGTGSFVRAGHISFAELIQLMEAAMNDAILLAAAIWFFASWERRRKRGKMVKALQELRSLAHLIDVHQLTKNPEAMTGEIAPTESSPSRDLSPPLMARYLDYCSEMLSLTGKIGVLYGEAFEDSEAAEAVTDLEELTIGLQRKIWQKVMILEFRMPRSTKRD
ncbi:MAG: hypothetical protein OEY14_18405, partial [Myxococcales bacterium]|nr:hypothetical protein [Myxococcales bacterium]